MHADHEKFIFSIDFVQYPQSQTHEMTILGTCRGNHSDWTLGNDVCGIIMKAYLEKKNPCSN